MKSSEKNLDYAKYMYNDVDTLVSGCLLWEKWNKAKFQS